MVIVDVDTVGKWTIYLLLNILHSDKRNDGDGECQARSARKNSILVSNGVDYLIEIAAGVVGLLRNHLEHP